MRWIVASGLVLVMSAAASAETYVPMGNLEVSCAQPGVEIAIDGQPWFKCPGTQTKPVSAGPHSVVGDREGFLPSRQNAFVPENGVQTLAIELVPMDRPVVVEHRFPRWLPWTVGGAGIGIGVLGLLTAMVGADKMNDFDQAVATQCAVQGCDFSSPEHAGLVDMKESAETYSAIGLGMMVGGVAVLGTGVVLLVMNKPVRQVPDVAVVPTNGGAAATAAFRF